MRPVGTAADTAEQVFEVLSQVLPVGVPRHLIDTGNEFAFHVPGDGIVFGQAGRLVLAADGSELSFAGHSVVNTSELCAALSP